MAMISPLNTSSMWQTDIETGKVISEWKFQKDTVDVAMKDMAGKDKAAAVSLACCACCARCMTCAGHAMRFFLFVPCSCP